ncbi:MAG: delta-60 repeat domain-containing protein [Crocinitomicaceae bacterium]|nr:delta-60 repeat domain-containing protein [Crocinitomicaceae bacterium]
MRWHFLFFASCISQTFALAQAGSNDASFNTFDSCHWGDGNGFNSFVYDCAIQPDGKIVAIGLFSAFNNNAAPHIIRLNSDGTRDETFQVPGTGFGGAVPNDVEICPNGKIVVCGNFTDYNGTPVQEVVVLNTDGSLDLSFISGTGFNNAVNTIAI